MPPEPEVTEGSSGVWETLHYDLVGSEPRRHEDDRLEPLGRVTPATSIPSRATPTGRPTWMPSSVRDGKNLKGREHPAAIPGTAMVDAKLEVVVIPVSDVQSRHSASTAA